MKFPLVSVLLLASIPIGFLIYEPTRIPTLIGLFEIFIIGLITLALMNIVDYLVYRDITTKFEKEKKL